MIEHVSLLGSTNGALLARLSAGEAVAEGHWLVTDRQVAGRGRQGRVWFDGLGNFMGSTVVQTRPGDPPSHTLALVTALALYEAVSPLLPQPHRATLKWPNDLMLGQAKLAGILLERSGDSVVVGVGVNLAAAPALEDRETIALSSFGPAPDRDTFASSFAQAFATDLDRWRTYGLEPILSRWCMVAHPQGTLLHAGEPGEVPIEGRFAGLDAQGALLLALADGTTRTIHAGEVRLGGSN